MILRLLALLAVLAAPCAAETGYVGMDDGRPQARGVDGTLYTVGDVVAGNPKTAEPRRSSSNIFPVYAFDGRWLLLDRSAGKGRIAKGSRLLVIGSAGIEEFTAAKSSANWGAACTDRKPSRVRAWWLKGESREAFATVGTPVVAILLKENAAFDLSKAHFYALKNEVRESIYQRLDFAIRKANVEDLKTGSFAVKPGDDEGRNFAADPDPLRLQMKIDFGSRLRVKGLKDAFLLVEGTQVSQTYRRCMRLFEGKDMLGGCVAMPNVLMAETRALEFVAYDPTRGGSPFVLAYTTKEPLWGHERWGFRVTPQGPLPFLMDALDPRCRENF
ncbi:MAG: hypothetical protein WC969_02865 [Elusimicrobiota bacterium]|jgi:hypothetical protein